MSSGGIDYRVYVEKDSLLYQIYKDRMDPETKVPDAWMSIRRAAAFTHVNAQLILRQVHAGLLPSRSRGTRYDVNPKDIILLNYDKNGVRQIVDLKTGIRTPLRNHRRKIKPDIVQRATLALRWYPEWVTEVDDFIAYAESKNSITSPRISGAPVSITNIPGDKTGRAAQIIADMPKQLAVKARWVRIIYDIVYRQRKVLNRDGLSARTYLEMSIWGIQTTNHQELGAMLGFSAKTSQRYMHDIATWVALAAAKYNL